MTINIDVCNYRNYYNYSYKFLSLCGMPIIQTTFHKDGSNTAFHLHFISPTYIKTQTSAASRITVNQHFVDLPQNKMRLSYPGYCRGIPPTVIPDIFTPYCAIHLLHIYTHTARSSATACI